MRQTIRVAMYAAMLTATAGQVQAAPFYSNGSWYDLTVPKSWNAAEVEAVSRGGHLATINNAAENFLLSGAFGSSLYWIGYTDKDVEGQFEWISGENATYVNWAGGEPNNASGIEDYTVINWFGGEFWNDYSGDVSFSGIIEAPNVAPIVSFFGPGSAAYGSQVSFNGAASFEPNASFGDSIVSYKWTVNGDSFGSSQPSAFLDTSLLSGPGTYEIQLHSEDMAGATAMYSQMLEVTGSSSASTVPEPSSLALLGLGSIGMACGSRRRRRRSSSQLAGRSTR